MFSHTILPTLLSLTAALAATPPVTPASPAPVEVTVRHPLAAGDLILNRPHEATADASTYVMYSVTLSEPGVLNVLLDGTSDLILRIRDADGELLCETDGDLDARLGREALSLRIREAGVYKIEIDNIGDERSAFTVIASHTPFAPFQRDATPPAPRISAEVLAANSAVTRTVQRSEHGNASYFVVTPTRDGLLTILTRDASDDVLDLMLEQYAGDDFRGDALRSADDDLGGALAQEAMTIAVRAGVPIFLRVAVLDGATGARYQLVTELR